MPITHRYLLVHVLFAIANATAICMEQQLESLLYSVGEMRRHFAGCLEDKLIRHFPAKKRNLRKATKRVEVMNVFCTCRMPEEDLVIHVNNGLMRSA